MGIVLGIVTGMVITTLLFILRYLIAISYTLERIDRHITERERV